jgi:hypothetical protein
MAKWVKNAICTHQVGGFDMTIDDALPTPWRTQMWVQVKDNGRRRSRDALPSSQHFEG